MEPEEMRDHTESLTTENLKELLEIVNEEIVGTGTTPGGLTADLTANGYSVVNIARLLDALDS